MRFQFSGPPQKRGLGCTCLLCLPRPERLGQPGAWRPLPGRGALFPSAAPARAASRVSGSLQTGTRGLFAVWEGVASLGLSLHLSPPPCLLPPAGMAGSSLQFLSPFVLRTAHGVFRLVNFSSLSHSLKKKKPPFHNLEMTSVVY